VGVVPDEDVEVVAMRLDTFDEVTAVRVDLVAFREQLDRRHRSDVGTVEDLDCIDAGRVPGHAPNPGYA
jgi:hypothetical protein